VSLTDGDDRDSKLLCRELVRMCSGVYEAPCILLLIVGKIERMASKCSCGT